MNFILLFFLCAFNLLTEKITVMFRTTEIYADLLSRAIARYDIQSLQKWALMLKVDFISETINPVFLPAACTGRFCYPFHGRDVVIDFKLYMKYSDWTLCTCNQVRGICGHAWLSSFCSVCGCLCVYSDTFEAVTTDRNSFLFCMAVHPDLILVKFE